MIYQYPQLCRNVSLKPPNNNHYHSNNDYHSNHHHDWCDDLLPAGVMQECVTLKPPSLVHDHPTIACPVRILRFFLFLFLAFSDQKFKFFACCGRGRIYLKL